MPLEKLGQSSRRSGGRAATTAARGSGGGGGGGMRRVLQSQYSIMMDDRPVRGCSCGGGSQKRGLAVAHFDRDHDTAVCDSLEAIGVSVDPSMLGPVSGCQDSVGAADVPAAGAGLYCKENQAQAPHVPHALIEPGSDATTTSLDGGGRKWSRLRWMAAFRRHVLDHCGTSSTCCLHRSERRWSGVRRNWRAPERTSSIFGSALFVGIWRERQPRRGGDRGEWRRRAERRWRRDGSSASSGRCWALRRRQRPGLCRRWWAGSSSSSSLFAPPAAAAQTATVAEVRRFYTSVETLVGMLEAAAASSGGGAAAAGGRCSIGGTVRLCSGWARWTARRCKRVRDRGQGVEEELCVAAADVPSATAGALALQSSDCSYCGGSIAAATTTVPLADVVVVVVVCVALPLGSANRDCKSGRRCGRRAAAAAASPLLPLFSQRRHQRRFSAVALIFFVAAVLQIRKSSISSSSPAQGMGTTAVELRELFFAEGLESREREAAAAAAGAGVAATTKVAAATTVVAAKVAAG
ncbi:hypothetical protein DFJ73DRAFT_966923 [Zopfochytrium polystomum]|nr:hypothetical protein DFJ73DRAFT_966923 [Zopfochytrium polystomum]